MNDTEVNKTILQMVRFIKQEADEKAREITVSAEEEFNITKLQLLESERAKIRREFERKESAIEVRRKVELSKQLNESRLNVLRAQEEAMQSIMLEAQSKLSSIAKDTGAYSKLLIQLIVQGMNKLREPEVLIRCREVDLDIVKSILPNLPQEYSKKYQSEKMPSVELDESRPLPKPPSAGKSTEEFETCLGGVVLTSKDGRIVCSNTLDDRLRIAYGKFLPEIRSVLFES